MRFFLIIIALHLFGLDSYSQQYDLVGIVGDQLIKIDADNPDYEVVGTLNPTPNGPLRLLTYVESECLFYGILNSGASPALISIDVDLNYTVIGTLTLPGNTIYFLEGMAYNDSDDILYVAASLNGSTSGGDFYSEAILEVNRANAACTFKTELIGNFAFPDADRMTFGNNTMYFMDGFPGPDESYFLELDFTGLGSTGMADEMALISYVSLKDMEYFIGNVYYTSGRDLLYYNTNSYTFSTVGTLFAPSDFNGDEIFGLTENPFPDYLTLIDSVSLCDGPVEVSLDYPYSNVSWNVGTQGSSIIITEPGSYWADVIYKGCSFRTDTVVAFYGIPDMVEITQDTSFCSGESIQLEIDPSAYDVTWSNGSTDDMIQISEGGFYFVQYSLSECAQVTIFFNVHEIEGDYSIGGEVELCGEEAFTLVLNNAGDDVIWNTGTLGNTILIDEEGLYWADIFINGCTFRTDTLSVIKPEPLDISIGVDTLICENETLTLTIEESLDFVFWNDGTFGNELEISAPGTYYATYGIGSCVYNTDTITVDILDLEFTLGVDVSICEGESAVLSIEDVGTSVVWNTGDTDNPLIVTDSGLYWAEVESQGCLFDTDTIEVVYTEPIQLDLPSDTTLCEGQIITISSNQMDVVLTWNDGSFGSSIDIASAGQYFAFYELDGCIFGTDTINVVNAEPLQFNLTTDTTICNGQTILFTIEHETVDFIWNDGTIGNTIEINSAGQYYASYTLGDCVFSTDTITVMPVDALVELGENISLCPGEEFTLEVSGIGQNVTWNTGFTGNELIINEAGSYWAEITVDECTLLTDTFEVYATEPIEFDIGQDTVLCASEILTIEIETSVNPIVWNTGVIGNVIEINEPGIYFAQYENQGCSFTTDSIVVSVFDVSLELGEDVIICEGDVATLMIEHVGDNAAWNTGYIGNTLVTDEPGLYWAVIDSNGCLITSDTVEVIEVLPLEFEFATDTTICDGQTITIIVNDFGFNLVWNDGTTGSSIDINSEGQYYGIYELDGCSITTDTINVQTIQDIFELGEDISICDGEVYTIELEGVGENITWNTGVVGSNVMISEEGSYYAEIILEECVIATDTINVAIVPKKFLDIGLDRIVCDQEEATIEVQDSNSEYLWNTGEEGSIITVTENGQYWVNELNAECPGESDTIEVRFIEDPTARFNLDTVLCQEENLFFPESEYEINWQNGTDENLISTFESGIFWGNYEVETCNFLTDTLSVHFIDCTPCSFYIPNIFSPNSDSANDHFEVVFSESCAIENVRLVIFDRWGNVIHSVNNSSWDGTMNGVRVANGVYGYLIEFDNITFEGKRERLMKYGDVTLIR